MPHTQHKLTARPFRCATIGCKSEGQLRYRKGIWRCRRCDKEYRDRQTMLARMWNPFQSDDVVGCVADGLSRELATNLARELSNGKF